MKRVVELNTAVKKEMNGVHNVAHFLWIHVQPLQARISQMWSYDGAKDKSRTSEEEVSEETLQKQICSLTKLRRKDKIPPHPVKPFTASKPVPKVHGVNLKFYA
jgi:hypothetical protein